LISNMFRDPKQRSLAIGVWLVCFIGGGAVGPIVGGALLEHFWWGSVFLVGVPVMVLLLAIGPFFLPEHRDETAGRIDLYSVVLSLGAILPVIYGLKELAKDGLHTVPILAIVCGVAIGTSFLRRQRQLRDPILDTNLFRNRAFSTALGSLMACTMLGGATMVFTTQYLQLVAGLSPLDAGIAMLPGMGASILSFQLSPIVARRIRPATLISGGIAVAVVGLLAITQASASDGLTAVVIGFVLMSLGSGPLVTLGTDLVVGSAPVEKAGSAAAINETSAELGFALGIAAFGSLVTATYRGLIEVPATLSGAVTTKARESLASAAEVAATLDRGPAGDLLTSAREAFTTGLHIVSALAALVMIAVAIVVVRMLKHVRAYGDTEPVDVIAAEVSPVEATLHA
jgi:MFS transporter, DHA2 family, multidrug resistance protein